MLRFFRQIRQRLLTENRVSKYLLYAIGEILLVVIGILIALQVNNWNEQSKDREIERKWLLAIHAEVTTNIQHFNEIIQFHKDSRIMCIDLLRKFSDPDRTINHAILDSLVEHATAPITLNPQIGNVKSIISTGDIKYIRNESIIQFVTGYEDALKDPTDDFNRLLGVWNSQLWPLENLYVRRINRAHSNNEWLGVDLTGVSAQSDYEGFFKDIVLENAYMLTLYEQTEIIKKEESLRDRMKSILEVINSELLLSE